MSRLNSMMGVLGTGKERVWGPLFRSVAIVKRTVALWEPSWQTASLSFLQGVLAKPHLGTFGRLRALVRGSELWLIALAIGVGIASGTLVTAMSRFTQFLHHSRRISASCGNAPRSMKNCPDGKPTQAA